MQSEGVLAAVKRQFGWVILAIFVGMVISIWAAPLTEAKLSSNRVGSIGLILGVWGLIFSIVGFAITWRQISQTQKSAEAVASAMQKIKRDYGTFDIVSEARSAFGFCEATLAHMEGERWAQAASTYNETSKSLFRIIATLDKIDSDKGVTATEHNNDALIAVATLEQLSRGNEPFDQTALRRQIRELVGFLIFLEHSEKGNISGH
jgi:hypothetical protein